MLRLASILILSLMLDVGIPLAPQFTERVDEYSEAVHRPPSRLAIRLVRELPVSGMDRRAPKTEMQTRRRAAARSRVRPTFKEIRKMPSPVADFPSPSEDH